MSIKERLEQVASLAKELEEHRGRCKALADSAAHQGAEGEDISKSEPFRAWWNRCERYLAEISYMDALMDAYEASSKHRRVIRLKYFEGLTWEEVARRMHYAESHCRRIAEAAIREIEESRRWEQMDVEDVVGQ